MHFAKAINTQEGCKQLLQELELKSIEATSNWNLHPFWNVVEQKPTQKPESNSLYDDEWVFTAINMIKQHILIPK